MSRHQNRIPTLYFLKVKCICIYLFIFIVMLLICWNNIQNSSTACGTNACLSGGILLLKNQFKKRAITPKLQLSKLCPMSLSWASIPRFFRGPNVNLSLMWFKRELRSLMLIFRHFCVFSRILFRKVACK